MRYDETVSLSQLTKRKNDGTVTIFMKGNDVTAVTLCGDR
jgi:hypothetical protein